MLPETLVGRELHSTYRVMRPISKGGMGAIYEAVHTRLPGKRYALKVLHPAFSENEELLLRFRREAEICSALGHEHIVNVLDTNVTPEGVAYLVMELLDGEDLAARIKARGPMPLPEVLRITGEIASALAAAHQAHVVHRDLKPQNVFLTRRAGRDDVVKVLDFGVSKVLDSQSVMTREHALVGTPYYMSPEQADGRVTDIDPRTDVFALGAIVWEMLTGKMAFGAPNHSVALYRVAFVDPPEVHTLRPDVPPPVSAVLRRAMAKVRDQRTPGVLELARELEAAVRGVMPANVPPPALGSMASLAYGNTVAPATDPVPASLPAATEPVPMPPMPSHVGSVASVAGASGEVSVPPLPRKSRAPMWIAAGVVVAAFAGGAAYVALQGGETPPPAPVAAVTPPPQAPAAIPRLTPPKVEPPVTLPPVEPTVVEPPPSVPIPSPEPVMIAVAEKLAVSARRRAALATKPAPPVVEPAAQPPTRPAAPPPVPIEPARPTPPPVAAQPQPTAPVYGAPHPVQQPPPPQQQQQQPPPPPKKKRTGTIFDD